jgi:predicted nucleic acid-binding Zn ribbon protein
MAVCNPDAEISHYNNARKLVYPGIFFFMVALILVLVQLLLLLLPIPLLLVS